MPVIFVGGDKGGVGKDTVSQALINALLEDNKKIKIHEVEVNRRLEDFFPESEYYPVVSTSIEEAITTQGQKALEGFEMLARALDEAPEDEVQLVILGASQTTGLMNYLGAGEDSICEAVFGQGEDVTFAIVTTMQETAILGAADNLTAIRLAMPKARRFAVLNNLVADFLPEDPWLDTVLAPANEVPRVSFTRCASPAWGHLMSAGPLHTFKDRDAVTKFLVEERQQHPKSSMVIVGYKMLAKWISETTDAVRTMLPKETKPKKPVASVKKPEPAVQAEE